MKRTVSAILLVMLLTSMLPPVFNLFFAAAEAPPMEWARAYGGTNEDYAYSIVQTGDGGYALAGSTCSYGGGSVDCWLVRTDSSGNTLWSKTYGGSGGEIAYSMIKTSDGGFALAGYTSATTNFHYDFWLVKTDAVGNQLWSKTYGGLQYDVAYSVVQTSDGGYAVAGVTNAYSGSGAEDALLVKTDSSGNMMWSKTYGGANADGAYSIVQVANGGYAIAGFTLSYGVGGFWLVKTDADGNILWSNTYGGPGAFACSSLVLTGDGGYALAGDTQYPTVGYLLVKADSSGNMLWSKTFATDAPYKCSLIQTTDGGYGLAAMIGFDDPDFWFVKTDATGGTMWDATYGGAAGECATSIIRTSDGGYALAGHTYSYGAGSADFWLVKVGSDSPPPIYSLTITATAGGTTSPAPGSYGYGAGAVISVSAWQYGGYQFDHWELDSVNVGSASPYSVRMNSAHALRAVFAASSQRPIACFFYSPRTLSPVIGEDVWFDASQSKGAVLYTWDFSDPLGPTSTIFPKIPHVFHGAGTYNVKLTVTNSNGQTDTTCKTVNVKRPPVILVHGFQSLDNYDEEEIWNVMKNSLTSSGLTVYVSHYAWGSVTSEPIRRYAESLKGEIDQIRRNEGVDKVDIVAHSMGGLVARRYIESGGGEGYVRKLIMLETPNRGCLFPGVSGLLAQAVATCILAGADPQVETWMNRVSALVDRIPFINDEAKATLKLIKYAGYVSSNLARVIAISEWQSYVDILAGMPSVSSNTLQNVHYANIIGWLGRIHSIHGIFTLDGVETADLPNWANWHASLPKIQEVIDKVKFILNDDPGPVLGEEGNDEPGIQSVTSISNTIFQGEMVTHRIPISNASLADFVLVWSEGSLNLTLVSPNGTLIDPSYVNPSVAYYGDSLLTIQGYAIENPVAGVWNVSVLGANVPVQGAEYALSTYVDTSTVLSLELSKNLFEPNEAFSIRANLTFCNQPIIEASLNVTIQKPDNLTESIALYDDGLHEDNQVNDGLYGNVFTNTSMWGTYQIAATANGSLNNEQFIRQEFATAWVGQYPDLSLTDPDITFSNEAPTEGQTIAINATIHNIGEVAAHNASILFYDGNQANGSLIGECRINVLSGEAETASIQWNTTRGEHEINAIVSPYNEFLEMNYTNNVAIKTIEVTGHDLAVLTIITAKTVADQAYGIPIDVVIENQGDFAEDFNVTLYANATIIEVETVTSVPNGTWTILTFTWNTTGYAKGNYTISAVADTVLGETSIADNTLTDGWVFVAMPGDVNADRIVDIFDITTVALAFNSIPGDSNWNPIADINNDNIVDIFDIVVVALHFGETG
jgi:pimeloyl-ACP methyl ester carboxylesterase